MTWEAFGLGPRCLVCLFLRHGSSIQMICRSSLDIEKKAPNAYLNPGLAHVSTRRFPVGTRYNLLEACARLNRHSQIVAGRTNSTSGSTGAESRGDRAKSGHSDDHRGGLFWGNSPSSASGPRTSKRPLPSSSDTSDELIAGAGPAQCCDIHESRWYSDAPTRPIPTSLPR